MTLRDRIERILREMGVDNAHHFEPISNLQAERNWTRAQLATDLAAALERDMPTLAVHTAEGVQHYLGIDFGTDPPTVTDVPAIREGRE